MTRSRLFLFLLLLSPLALYAQNPGKCEDKLIRYSEYTESPGENYLLKLNHKSGGALLFFGARHSDNPEDEQFADIKKAYQEFRPDLVFYEGPKRPLGKDEAETIRKYGESGYIRFLATADSIPVESLEPNPLNEFKYILKKFTPEQAILFYTLREAARLRERKKASPDEIRQAIDQIFSRLPAFEGVTIKNTTELEQAYKKYWNNPAMWYDAPSGWFDPLKASKETGGIFTNELNAESSQYRNINMYELLVKTVREGKRVFAVVGRNHVPMLKEAVKCALEQ